MAELLTGLSKIPEDDITVETEVGRKGIITLTTRRIKFGLKAIVTLLGAVRSLLSLQ